MQILFVVLLLAFFMNVTPEAVAGDGYERYKETSWVREQLGKGDAVIIDVRKKEEYEGGHIPEAINLPSDAYTFERTQIDGKHLKFDIPTPAEFIDVMSAHGITEDTTVIVYGSDVQMMPARLAWILRNYGHEKVYLVNGGIDKWVAVDGFPIEKAGNTPQAAQAPYVIRHAGLLRVYKSHVLEAISDPERIIHDVRSEDEYNGKFLFDDRDNARRGHIPGAIFSDYMTTAYVEYRDANGSPVKGYSDPKENVRILRNSDELRVLFAARGLDASKTIYNYCEAGFRAADYTFILQELGYTKVYTYDGSWNEWSKQSQLYPVE